MSSQLTYEDLQKRAQDILVALCNDRNKERASELISPNVIVQHQDEAPSTSLQAFLGKFDQLLKFVPELHVSIKESCVDVAQRKVWMKSDITGLPGGAVTESVDMMEFDEGGLLIRSVDCQRQKSLS